MASSICTIGRLPCAALISSGNCVAAVHSASALGLRRAGFGETASSVPAARSFFSLGGVSLGDGCRRGERAGEDTILRFDLRSPSAFGGWRFATPSDGISRCAGPTVAARANRL